MRKKWSALPLFPPGVGALYDSTILVALRKLDGDEKGVASTDTLGGRQEMQIVSESGLYALVLRCRDAMTPGSAFSA